MNVFTAARAHLVDLYQLAGIDAYTYTPPTIVPPIVTVLTSSWIEPNRVGKFHARVGLMATAYVSLIDSSVALEQLEQLVEELSPRRLAASSSLRSMHPRRLDKLQGDLLASDITIHAQVRKD